jgi:replicative DNA helicase
MTTAITGSDGRLSSMADLLTRTDEAIRRGVRPGAAVIASGFSVLDDALEGGFRSGELVLLGGPQGLGKTTMVMQMVRNVVRSGGSAVVFSYEHEGHTLLERLLSLEASLVAGLDAARLPAIRNAFEHSGPPGETLDDRLAGLRGVGEGLQTMRRYAGRLHIHESTGATTDLEEIARVVEAVQADDGMPPLVVVDYLQKVPVPGGPGTEEERVTIVVERLKDLTLSLGVPIVAIVAADKASLVAGKRMRVHDLRGSSALAYEADVVLILNDKYDVVARHHLVYDLGNAERYKQWVVMTIEKNRHGVDGVELEFRKAFAEGRFEASGQYVLEQLIEERVFTE